MTGTVQLQHSCKVVTYSKVPLLLMTNRNNEVNQNGHAADTCYLLSWSRLLILNLDIIIDQCGMWFQ